MHALHAVGGRALEVGVRPGRSSAFTSTCAASHGASSERKPVSTLTTPPGTSDVAIASASSIAASGCVSDASTTAALPPTITGAMRETMPSSGGSSGATTPTTPVGSGSGEVEVRARDGIRRAEHLRELVRPARVPDDPVDRALDLFAAGAELRELGGARLDHLREPVEHLPAVVRGHARPTSGTRRAPRAQRRARPCATRARRSAPRPRTCVPTRCAGTRRR